MVCLWWKVELLLHFKANWKKRQEDPKTTLLTRTTSMWAHTSSSICWTSWQTFLYVQWQLMEGFAFLYTMSQVKCELRRDLKETGKNIWEQTLRQSPCDCIKCAHTLTWMITIGHCNPEYCTVTCYSLFRSLPIPEKVLLLYNIAYTNPNVSILGHRPYSPPLCLWGTRWTFWYWLNHHY